jgi:hypothetical protein
MTTNVEKKEKGTKKEYFLDDDIIRAYVVLSDILLNIHTRAHTYILFPIASSV